MESSHMALLRQLWTKAFISLCYVSYIHILQWTFCQSLRQNSTTLAKFCLCVKDVYLKHSRNGNLVACTG